MDSTTSVPKEKLSTKGHMKNFMFYGLFSAAISIMWGAYNNYLPIILQAGNPSFQGANAGVMGFGLSAFTAGLLMSMDNLLGAFALPIWGALGDRSTRRKDIGALTGIICAVSFMLLPVIANMVTPETSGQPGKLVLPIMLIAFFAFICVFTDAVSGPFRSGYQFAVLPKAHHNKMMSFSVTLGGVGFLAATLGSSYLYEINKGFPFYVGGGIMILICVLFAVMMPSEAEKNKRLEEERAASGGKLRINPFKTIVDAFKLLSRDVKICMVLILVAKNLALFGVVGLQTFGSSWMLVKLDIQPNMAMIATGVFFIGYMLAAIPMGYIADKANKVLMYSISIVAMILGGLAFLFLANGFVAVCIIGGLVGVFQSIVDVITLPYVLSFAPEGSNVTGTIYSMTVSALVWFSVINVPLMGKIIDITGNYDSLFYSMIISAALAVIPLAALQRKLKKINAVKNK